MGPAAGCGAESAPGPAVLWLLVILGSCLAWAPPLHAAFPGPPPPRGPLLTSVPLCTSALSPDVPFVGHKSCSTRATLVLSL